MSAANGHSDTQDFENLLLQQMVGNASLFPREILKRLDSAYNGRDINKECGYPDDLDIEDFVDMYEREGVGTRVVEVFPDESWSYVPEVYETSDASKTAFEIAWEETLTKHNVWHVLHRSDIQCGIGRFGVIFFGLDDVRSSRESGSGVGSQILKKPVDGFQEDGTVAENVKENNIMFIRVLNESRVKIKEWENNPANPRYGQPKIYELNFGTDPFDKGKHDVQDDNTVYEVHWSRVLHVTDKLQSSESFSVPRMRPVYNRLVDIRKIAGGSGEMFWRGAFPGYSFEINPNVASNLNFDKDSVKEEFRRYSEGLQRYLSFVGVTAKSLSPQVADPSNHLAAEIKLVAMTIGVPLRVFVGSEEAKLASEQDSKAWNRRLARRQNQQLTPRLIRPFVDRLIDYGVLPRAKKYSVDWPDLNTPTDQDRADVAAKQTTAIAQYATSGAETYFPLKEFLHHILGMSIESADSIVKAAQLNEPLMEEDDETEAEDAMRDIDNVGDGNLDNVGEE